MASTRRRRIFMLVLVGWIVGGSAVWAADGGGARRCEVAKVDAVRKMAECRLAKLAKGASGDTGDGGRCSARLEAAFRRAEARAGVAGCRTRRDAGAIAARVDSMVDGIGAALAGVRFVDNGDGTISDTQTGLMWEKKDGADGVPNPDDPHDVDNFYPWSVSGTTPDGPAFTEFLARLNACTTEDGVTVTGGFAGHCDWRLPTIPELATLLDGSVPGCGTGAPCTPAIFEPAQPYFYFSSTTKPDLPRFAWIVDFHDGQVFFGGKIGLKYTRAARGGP
jgi:hypothetical protein